MPRLCVAALPFILALSAWSQTPTKAELQRRGRDVVTKADGMLKNPNLSAADAQMWRHMKAMGQAATDEKWVDYLEQARWLADHEVPGFRTLLAQFLMAGIGTNADKAAGIQTLKQAADDGDRAAMRYLAQLYEQGKDAPQDLEEAFHWYQMMADHGDVSGRRYMARAYENGLGVRPDAAKAKLYQEIVAGPKKEPDPDDQRIADTFAAPAEVLKAYNAYRTQDPGALRMAQALADKKDAAGLTLMGRIYQEGAGAPKDPVKSREFYAAAADAGNPVAQVHLGSCYITGAGCPQDLDTAQRYLKPVAEAGWRVAQYALAATYARRSSDRAERIKWLRAAAEQDLRQAQSELGDLLKIQAPAEAIKWWTKAGVECQYGAAAVNASHAYQTGIGTARDPAEAFRWAERAAVCGVPRGWTQLGNQYLMGAGTEANEAEAARCFRVAAHLGDPLAQFNLGELYRTGKGVERNPEAAAKWYLKFARQRREGEPGKALSRLGSLYESGELAPAAMELESPRAAAWVFYELADRGGFHADRAKRDALYAAMPDAERDAAAKALAPWEKLYPARRPVTAATDGAVRTVRVTEYVLQKRLIRNVTPIYPPEAKANHVEGVVVLNVVIGTDGAVESAESISGDEALVASAIAAVKQWKYRPTTISGAPVKVASSVRVTYPGDAKE